MPLVADDPISDPDPSLDLLNRGPLAERLAERVLQFWGDGSFVVGLYGPFGSGRSTLLFQIRNAIARASEGRASDTKPVAIRFEPWNFADERQLLTQFFQQLWEALRRSENSRDLRELAPLLLTYGAASADLFLAKPPGVLETPSHGIVTEYTLLEPWALTVFKIFSGLSGSPVVGGMLRKLADRMRPFEAKDLDDQRQELHQRLARSPQRLVILIDEIDRLSDAEIRIVFQLVKSVANFPNIVYVLAFDPDVVAKVLDRAQESSGRKYLEKIVQDPFQIPSQEWRFVGAELKRQILARLPAHPEVEPYGWDERRWADLEASCLPRFFENLRLIKRFINSTEFTFGPVRDEVNAMDFMLVSTIGMAHPSVYQAIKSAGSILTGATFGQSQVSKEVVQQFVADLVKPLDPPRQVTVREALTNLFPKLESVYTNAAHTDVDLWRWRRQRRICSPDWFDAYFEHRLPARELPYSDIARLLNAASEFETLRRLLVDINAEGKIVRLLEILPDYYPELIASQDGSPILQALLNVGDQLREGAPQRQGFPEGQYVVGHCVYILRQIADPGRRVNLALNAISKVMPTGVQTMVALVAYLGGEHGRHAPSKQSDQDGIATIPEPDLDAVEGAACMALHRLARSGHLDGHRAFAEIVAYWKRWSRDQHVDDYLNGLLWTVDGRQSILKWCRQPAYADRPIGAHPPNAWNLMLMREFLDFENLVRLLGEDCELGGTSPLPSDTIQFIRSFLEAHRQYDWDERQQKQAAEIATRAVAQKISPN